MGDRIMKRDQLNKFDRSNRSRPRGWKHAFACLSLGAFILPMGACTGEKKPEAQNDTAAADSKTEANAGEQPAGGKTAGPTDQGQQNVVATAPATPLAAGKLLEPSTEVLGHFMVPNATKLLADIRSYMSTPMVEGMLNESTLRSMAMMALESRGNLAQNIELDKPFGCAVGDVKVYQQKAVACIAGYKGGVNQLIQDLGKNNAAEAGKHAAAYKFEGQVVYFDDLEGAVAITLDDGMFDKAKGYLKTNMVGRAANLNADFEFAVLIGSTFERYRSELDGLLALIEAASAEAPKTGDPKLDAALQSIQSTQKGMTKQSINRLAEYSQMTFTGDVGAKGLGFGMSLVAKPGTRAAEEAAKYGGRSVSKAMLEGMPKGTIMMIAGNSDPNSVDMPEVKQAFEMLGGAWAGLTGGDKATAVNALNTYVQEHRGLYTGESVFAFVHQPGGVGGIVVDAALMPGKSGNDLWKKWTQTFTPEAVLGPEFSQYVTWKYQTGALTADGVTVDRWVIEPTEKAKGLMKISPSDQAEIDKWLGGLKLTIDRAEFDGHVVNTVGPKVEDAIIKRAIAARRGKDSLKGDAGLDTILRNAPEASGFFALDIHAGIEWLKSFPEPAKDLNKIPGPVGTNLADVYITFHMHKNGESGGEFVIGQQLIDQVRAFASKM